MGDQYDYSYGRPQMPQFREGNGRWDWRQMADMVIPGNVWNSRTNQWRPLGIASGLTGLPIDAAVGFGRGAGSFLSSIGRGRSGEMPDFSDSFGRIGNAAANSPFRNRDLIDRENQFIVNQTRNTESNIDDFRRGGGATRAERGESRIGLGQLGRGGDEAIAAADRAFWARNGALMER